LITGAYPAWNVSNALFESKKICLAVTLLSSSESTRLCVTAEFRLARQLGKLDQRALRLWTKHGAKLRDDPRLDESIIEIFKPLLQLGTLSLELLGLVWLVEVLLT
jgi:hypothetical protein